MTTFLLRCSCTKKPLPEFKIIQTTISVISGEYIFHYLFEGSDTELILQYERILSNPLQSEYLDNCTVCIAMSKKGSLEVIKCTYGYYDAYLIEDRFVRSAMKYRCEDGYHVLSLVAVDGKYLMYLNALGYEINEQPRGVIFGEPSLNISYYVAKKKA